MTKTITTKRSRYRRGGLATSCAVAAVLALSACDRDETTEVVEETTGDGGEGAATSYHEGDWAALGELDPHGEGCANCHGDGESQDIAEVHNVDLHQDNHGEGIENFKITGASVDDGELEVTFEVAHNGVEGEDLVTVAGEDSDIAFTFAKLAPNARQDAQAGHDWQNYFTTIRTGRDDPMLEEGAPRGNRYRPSNAEAEIEWSGAEGTVTFPIEAGADGEWVENKEYTLVGGEHDADAVTGIEVPIDNISEHATCAETEEDGAAQDFVCYWNDGTTLPAGVYVTEDDEFVIEYDETLTHRVGMKLRSRVRDDDPLPASNDTWDFRPDEEEVSVTRNIVHEESCNTCHDQLEGHTKRVETDLCVTCHNPGTVDQASGRSEDFKQMIHKVHRGSDLPSVNSEEADLEIVYNQNNISTINFPQGPSPGHSDGVTNCVKCHMGEESEQQIQEFVGDEEAFDRLELATVTEDGDNWGLTRSWEACRGCHDDVVWYEEDGEPYDSLYRDMGVGDDWREDHQGPNYSPGEECGGCHFDDDAIVDVDEIGINPGGFAGVHEAHLQLLRDAVVAKSFDLVIENPTVDEDGFEVDLFIEQDGTRLHSGDPLVEDIQGQSGNLEVWNQEDGDDQLQVYFSWMEDSPDYTQSTGDQRNPGAPTAAVAFDDWEDNGAGYTVRLGWDEISRYDWEDLDEEQTIGTVAVDGSLQVTGDVDELNLGQNDDGEIYVRSETKDFRFDGSAPGVDEGRREVVDFDQTCRSCHMNIRRHGNAGPRHNNTQVCVTCHTPHSTDVARSGARIAGDDHGDPGAMKIIGEYDEKHEESEDFKRMVHAIHASGREDGGTAQSATSPFRMADVQIRDQVRDGTGFPGVLDNCTNCHIENDDGQQTFVLDQLPEGLIGSSALTGDWYGTDFTLRAADIHDVDTHRKMSPISAVCTSCHDGGIQRPGGASGDGGVLGWHIWEQGGVAPKVAPQGDQSTDFSLRNYSQLPLSVPEE